MSAVLDIAKITSKGQITIPASVRREMGLGEGDRVLFVLEDDGRITLSGSNLDVLRAAQSAFRGKAEAAGLRDPDDIVELVKAYRREGEQDR